MNNSLYKIDFISVVAGVVMTLATLFMFMGMAAGLGVWTYSSEELALLGSRFWWISSFCWALSVLVGSTWAVMSSATKTAKDALFNSVTSWAGSYLVFGGIAFSMADSNYRVLLTADLTQRMFWHGFLGDFFALIAGVAAAPLGTFLKNLPSRETSKKTFLKEQFNANY